MKILFVIDMFIEGGASNAMIGLIEGLLIKNIESKIFTRENYSTYNKVEISVGDGNELVEYIKINSFDRIHWFRTNFSILSHSYFDACEKKKFQSPFIFVTLCQVPKSFLLRLTLRELKGFDYFIFICKEAYNYKYHKIIPDERKAMIYFGTHHIDRITPKDNYSDEVLVFGRGSTLNKCPDDMIENYLKISEGVKSKFKIAGDGDTSKILNKVKQLNCPSVIELVPHLSPDAWFSFLRSLDIYLYQLPADTYSAIDATIQDAMLAEIPVVILGPEAPKELVINGFNGFAASSITEFIGYARQLVNDAALRKKIGKAGRLHMIENFPHSKTVDNYYNLYHFAYNRTLKKFKIPFFYAFKYKLKYLREEFSERTTQLLRKKNN